MAMRIRYFTAQEIYVLENWPNKTYKTIGSELGVSMERVRQIRVKAERKVREEMRRQKGWDYDVFNPDPQMKELVIRKLMDPVKEQNK